MLGLLIGAMPMLAAQAQLDLRVPRDAIKNRPSESSLDLDLIRSDPIATAYIEGVSRKIEQAIFAWPQSDAGERRYGTVPILIVINADGSLTDVRPVAGRPRDPKLTSAAIKAVNSAAPFSAPPAALLRNNRTVQFIRAFGFEKKQ